MNQPKLQSQVFLRQDVAALLRALYVVHAQGLQPSLPDIFQAGYETGFAAAMRAVATALHIDPSFVADVPPVVSTDFRVLEEEEERLGTTETPLLLRPPLRIIGGAEEPPYDGAPLS